jgi:hypothetical protein
MLLASFAHGIVDLMCTKQTLSVCEVAIALLVVSESFMNDVSYDGDRLTRPQACFTGTLTICAYNLFFHPLSSYPGPFLWRAIRLPYVVRALQGNLVYDMLELHKRYGPIVRVAPNELALAYEGVWDQVLGGTYDDEMPKWETYYRVQPNQTEFIITAPPEEHSQMRRALAYGFSDRGICAMEFRMIRMLDKMLDRLLDFCGGTEDMPPKRPLEGNKKPGEAVIDIAKWCNFLTFDMVGELVFGESYECLETATYHPWVKPIVELTHYSGILANLGFYPKFQGLILKIFGGIICRRMDFHQKHSQAALERRAAMPDRIDLLSESLTQMQTLNDVSPTRPYLSINYISSVFHRT